MSDSLSDSFDRLTVAALALRNERDRLQRRVAELERGLAELFPVDQKRALEADNASLRQALRDMDGEAYLGLLADGSPTASLREIQRHARAVLHPANAKEEAP